VVSLAADVASIVLLTSGNENAGRILGYVGMATGLASAAPSIASAAAKKVKAFGMGVGSLQGRLQHAGGVPGGGRAFPGRAQRVGAEMPPMRNTDFSMMLEQTPIRESFLPHLSRGDLQNIGQTNSANMASVYRAGTSTAPVPLELPFRGTSGLVNGQIQEFGYPVIANPHYVNEVRQTISGTHPKYYPWQIGEAGIENPSQLRIIDRPVFEDYAAQRLAGDEPFRWGLMSFDSDFRWFSQRGEIAHRGWNCRIL
jgi:hypothetical protein